MKIKNKDLRSVIRKSIAESHALPAGEVVVVVPDEEPELLGQDVVLGDPHRGDVLFHCLVGRVGFLRAMHLWFHAAHHVTRGVGFSGDHASLYDTVYLGFQGEVDAAVEKTIGLAGDESAACPKSHMEIAMEILEDYPGPHQLDASDISRVGCDLVKDYLGTLDAIYEVLETEGHMSLGLDDQLSASANNAETFLYLLTQRSKTEIEN